MDVDTLKLCLDHTELFLLPAEESPVLNLSVNIENSVVSACQTPGILRVALYDQLSLATYIAATAHFFRVRLNNIRRMCPVFGSRAGLQPYQVGQAYQTGLQPYLHNAPPLRDPG